MFFPRTKKTNKRGKIENVIAENQSGKKAEYEQKIDKRAGERNLFVQEDPAKARVHAHNPFEQDAFELIVPRKHFRLDHRVGSERICEYERDVRHIVAIHNLSRDVHTMRNHVVEGVGSVVFVVEELARFCCDLHLGIV